MKKKLFLLLLLFSSIASFAQKKINVFCRVALDGVILYPKNLGDFLPDSLRASVLLNPRKDYKIKNLDNVLLFMGANGWKITSYDHRLDMYTLNREIYLDESAWEIYLEKLKDTGNRPK